MAAGCVLYVAEVLLLGYVALCLAAGRQRRTLAETAGLSLLLGLGNLGLLLFWLSLAGSAPSRAAQLCLCGALAPVAAVLVWRRRVATIAIQPPRKADALALVPGAVLAYAGVAAAIGCLALPVFYSDAYADWLLKAKVLAVEPLSPTPALFTDPCLSYAHQDYPLMLPMLTAALYGMMGQCHDQVGKLVGLLFYAGLALSAYGLFRRDLPRPAAAAMSALLAAAPAMVQYAGVGIADAPLAVFCLPAVFFSERWVKDEKIGDLALAALFTAFLVFTKNEGKAISAAVAMSLAAVSLPGFRKRRLAGLAAFLGAAVLLMTPWLLWSLSLPHTVEKYETKLSPSAVLGNLSQLGEVLAALLRQGVEWNLWGPLWILVPIAAAVGWRGFAQRHIRLLWLIALLHLAMYAYVFAACPPDLLQSILSRGTLVRVMLHISPAAAVLAAAHYSEARSPSPTAGPSS